MGKTRVQKAFPSTKCSNACSGGLSLLLVAFVSICCKLESFLGRF